MARVMSKATAVHQAWLSFPSFLRQRDQVLVLDKWTKGTTPADADPYAPRNVTDEYVQLSKVSHTPWLQFIIDAVVQTVALEGVNAPGASENLTVYKTWQRNGWDAKQSALYRSSMGHGAAFGVAMPGRDPLTGDRMTLMRAVSALRMAVFYDDPTSPDWPAYAIEADEIPHGFFDGRDGAGWTVQLYDEAAVYYLSCKNAGTEEGDWTFISYEEHPAGVTPIRRYANRLDLDGVPSSAIEPLIPLARRIDQDTFDRLIVQRFGAWKVRYIAGMAKPASEDAAIATAMRLRVEDLLISDNKDTKFGTLDATDLAGFISARDADLRDLSAVSQTPPHHMLGLSSNLQAESLAAAESGLQRKGVEHRTLWGEEHEALLRVTAKMDGNITEARMFDMQCRWRDGESRSLSQAADALSKLADGLGIPVEMLWERVPNWTDSDSERAKRLIEDGSIDQLLTALAAQVAAPPADPNAAPPAPVTTNPATPA